MPQIINHIRDINNINYDDHTIYAVAAAKLQFPEHKDRLDGLIILL
jgi:hypothetical protein